MTETVEIIHFNFLRQLEEAEHRIAEQEEILQKWFDLGTALLKANGDKWGQTPIQALRELEDAKRQMIAKLEVAKSQIAELEQMCSEAQDCGATIMLEQMEKAVAGGGRFSDERANRFVDSERRVRELEK